MSRAKTILYYFVKTPQSQQQNELGGLQSDIRIISPDTRLMVSDRVRITVPSNFSWPCTLRGSIFEPDPLDMAKSQNLHPVGVRLRIPERLLQRRQGPCQHWSCRIRSVWRPMFSSGILHVKGKRRSNPPRRSCVQKPFSPALAQPKAEPVQLKY